MRLLLALATLTFAVPAAANSGNSQAPVDQARRTICTKPSPADSRTAQRTAKTAECRPSRPVPWLVDPSPLFIL